MADNDDAVIGSAAIRPIFLGNLMPSCTGEAVESMFESPPKEDLPALSVDRVDMKRGFCFVFLKDVTTQSQKDDAERFVTNINGTQVNDVSRAVRAEFARGDGRVKQKEDERRKNIAPSETLFVVNFHEGTTTREDLSMLFEQYGSLVRIDLRQNYAFVQFKTVEEAKKAKDATDGGKLDQSVLTVEFVAQPGRMPRSRRSDDRRPPPRDSYPPRDGHRRDYRPSRGGDFGPPRGRDYGRDYGSPRGGDYGPPRGVDYGPPRRGPPPDRRPDDYRGRDFRRDDYRGRGPPSDERRPYRSRSRSPPSRYPRRGYR